jgi:hypothetical protein
MFVLCVNSGCQELPEVRVVGKYVEIAPYDDARICAGTVEELDRVAAQLEDRLELRYEQRIKFYWGWQGVDEQCPASGDSGQVQGCARPDESTVFGPLHVARHEFAHVLGGRVGVATPVLEEGFAYNAEGRCASSSLRNMPSSLIEMSEDMYDRLGGDITGTAFVNYFIDRFGREKLYQLKGRVPRGADANDFDRGVQSVLGLTLDELEQQWRDDSPLVSCGEPWRWDDEDMLTYSFAPITLDARLDCDALDTKGPVDPTVVVDDVYTFGKEPVQRGMYVDREIMLPFASWVSLSLEGPSNTMAYLRGKDCWDRDGFDGHIGIRKATLQPGETRVELLAGCVWRIFLVSVSHEITQIRLHMEPWER